MCCNKLYTNAVPYSCVTCDIIPFHISLSHLSSDVNCPFRIPHRDINYTSRKLFSSSYSQYGSTDADGEDSEQEDAITNRTSDESAGLIPDRENVMGESAALF